MTIFVSHDGSLEFQGRRYSCSLGKGGLRTEKREGDGATPIGRFPLRRLHFRSDVIPAPQTGLPVRPIAEHDGWCDDPSRPEYNQLVRLPFDGSHEEMWRTDGIYDLVVEIGYNDDPVVPELGSAIFMHIAKPGYLPTEGCVALERTDLLDLLAGCGPATEIEILDH